MEIELQDCALVPNIDQIQRMNKFDSIVGEVHTMCVHKADIMCIE